jgi:hypothetical protein
MQEMDTDITDEYWQFLPDNFRQWAQGNPILQILAQPPWWPLPQGSNIQFLGRGNFGCVLRVINKFLDFSLKFFVVSGFL